MTVNQYNYQVAPTELPLNNILNSMNGLLLGSMLKKV